MKERPILFSAPMVRALLDGSKTQTRRALKVRCQEIGERDDGSRWPWSEHPDTAGDHWHACPYGQLGERLWVRETHRPIFGQTCGLIAVDYQADPRGKWERLGDAPDSRIKLKWTPSIHMRRAYSRILLEITGVRVERLQDISDDDARAEGCSGYEGNPFDEPVRPAGEYCELWESINGAGSWDANPWVWVVEFRRIAP